MANDEAHFEHWGSTEELLRRIQELSDDIERVELVAPGMVLMSPTGQVGPRESGIVLKVCRINGRSWLI
jgi:hypothetical protein